MFRCQESGNKGKEPENVLSNCFLEITGHPSFVLENKDNSDGITILHLIGAYTSTKGTLFLCCFIKYVKYCLFFSNKHLAFNHKNW